MDIFIFSNSKSTKSIFSKLEKSKTYSINFYSIEDLKKSVKNIPSNSIIYFDINNLDKKNIDKNIKYLASLDNMLFGIIDPKNAIDDISDLFYNGAIDYIGKQLAKESISEKRLDKIKTFKPEFFKNNNNNKSKSSEQYILSGEQLKNIKPGQEYTFCLMFIELDGQADLKNKFDGKHLNTITERFQSYIGQDLEDINGKIWMWMDYGGLLLFPFDGKNCEAILSSYRLILDSNIISTEYIDYDIMLSYRIALHIGNTIYKKRGNTGNIISDSINSIFHLGQKFAKPGNLYLTEDISPYIPTGMEQSFVDAGEYEGRKIIKMKTLIR